MSSQRSSDVVLPKHQEKQQCKEKICDLRQSTSPRWPIPQRNMGVTWERDDTNYVSRRPKDTAFRQQRTRASRPVQTPQSIIAVYLIVGAVQLVLGVVLYEQSKNIESYKVQYGGRGTREQEKECEIQNFNLGRLCNLTFEVLEHLKGPTFLYYELHNFYANSADYVLSYDRGQLLGDHTRSQDELTTCGPLRTLGNMILNPCGLIANSLFNDQITLKSQEYRLDTKEIANSPEYSNKYLQPDAFKTKEVAQNSEFSVATCVNTSCATAICNHWFGAGHEGCKGYYCSEPDKFNCDDSTYYVFWYPRDSETQYLYETFPKVISPLKGAESARFQVWMETAAFPNFKVLYGQIDQDIPKGTNLTFMIENNYDVQHFDSKKFLVLTNTKWFGGNHAILGIALITSGSFALFMGFLFFTKNLFGFSRRNMGDLKLLR